LKARFFFLTVSIMFLSGCGTGKLFRKVFGPTLKFIYTLIIIKLFREFLGLSDTQIVAVWGVIVGLLALWYLVVKLKNRRTMNSGY